MILLEINDEKYLFEKWPTADDVRILCNKGQLNKKRLDTCLLDARVFVMVGDNRLANWRQDDCVITIRYIRVNEN